MTDPIEAAVARAISTIRTNFAEDITVDDLARAARFSKFHFTRMFQRTTGVSPARFLSAVRLQEAKHLLRSTSLKICDISRQVGYHSVGSFSSRFAQSVGLSPTAYRRAGGRVPQFPIHESGEREFGRVHGNLWPQRHRSGLIYLGLFPSRIPEGPPVRCLVTDRVGEFQLDQVPVGSYHLLCYLTPPGDDTERDGQQRLTVGCSGPLTVQRDQATAVEVNLSPLHPFAPPILLALGHRFAEQIS